MSHSQHNLNRDLELFLAIPAVQGEGMTEADWAAEIERMARHSRLTRQFISGEVSPADFECAIAEMGINPHELADLWEEGISLL